ncbi:MAG: lysozyme inhibitor LprI family protein [Sphingomonas bacterium]
MLIPVGSLAHAEGSPPSFSCKAAKTDVERTICADPELSDDDRKLALAYQAASKTVPPGELAAFRQNQRAWLDSRDSDCTPEDRASCIKTSYEARLKTLQFELRSPREGLNDLLWTDGVVCAGNKALIRFEHADGANAPPDIGGPLAHAIASKAQCGLADGRIVRFKTTHLQDDQAYGECGADVTELYSVWIGDDKIISREQRAGKCDSNPVRAIFLDGQRLVQCVEAKGPFDEKADAHRCNDISARLRKPIHDTLPSGQFTITYAAKGMRGFCEGMIHPGEPGEGAPDWPNKTVAPADTETLARSRFDLNNSGHSQPVIGIAGENHFFDGNFFMIAPRSMSAEAVAKVVEKQLDEPDPDAARKLGFQVFSGDQTPYREPRYVRNTAFRKDGATWLYATWAVNLPEQPTEIITQPQSNGTQKLICSYQATPDL